MNEKRVQYIVYKHEEMGKTLSSACMEAKNKSVKICTIYIHTAGKGSENSN